MLHGHLFGVYILIEKDIKKIIVNVTGDMMLQKKRDRKEMKDVGWMIILCMRLCITLVGKSRCFVVLFL